MSIFGIQMPRKRCLRDLRTIFLVPAIVAHLIFLFVPSINARTTEDVRKTSVGLPAKIEQLVLPAPKVVARKIEQREQPIVLRIVETHPHGDKFRYDLEYYGLETGRFNLAEYLVNEDTSPATHLPEIVVEINTIITSTELPSPNQIVNRNAAFSNFYSPVLLTCGALWLLGLAALIFVGRGTARRLTRKKTVVSLAERIRPLVELAIAGELDDRGKAELERTLEAFWQQKLKLKNVPANEVRVHLRQHPEAKQVLNQLDNWLHRPDASEPIDVNEFLKPYQELVAE